MKNILPLMMILLAMFSCNNLKVTTVPDKQNTTSGTLGSATFTNQLPPMPDTTKRVDTLKIVRDTLPK